jgi:NADH-quinone oxidoreductase subunit F
MFSLSGKVNKPGNYEAEMGVTARELIEVHGGGILDGKALKAWTPGGSSTPMLTAEHYDTPMDFDGVMAAGSMLGTGAMMIMDERDCIVEAVWRMGMFYANESCGKCTTCREGNWWTTRILKRIETGQATMEDIDLLNNVAGNQLFKGFCALVDGATSPNLSGIKHFREEFEAHVTSGGCPMRLKAGVA